MVEDRDADEVADAAKARGQLDVRSGWRRVPRRVVMGQDNRRCGSEDSRLEDLPRMNLDAGEGAYRDGAPADDLMPDVQKENHEVLAVLGAQVREKRVDLRGAGNSPKFRRRRWAALGTVVVLEDVASES